VGQVKSGIVTSQTGDVHLEHLVEGMLALTPWVELLTVPAPMVELM